MTTHKKKPGSWHCSDGVDPLVRSSRTCYGGLSTHFQCTRLEAEYHENHYRIEHRHASYQVTLMIHRSFCVSAWKRHHHSQGMEIFRSELKINDLPELHWYQLFDYAHGWSFFPLGPPSYKEEFLTVESAWLEWPGIEVANRFRNMQTRQFSTCSVNGECWHQHYRDRLEDNSVPVHLPSRGGMRFYPSIFLLDD